MISQYPSLVHLRYEGAKLTRKKENTRLAVFSGKEASLNRVIFLILINQKEDEKLVSYDVWRLVKAIKGFRHTPYRSICRRIRKLDHLGWIANKGLKKTKPSGLSPCYSITLRAQVALKLSEISLDDFLQSATEEQLLKLSQAID